MTTDAPMAIAAPIDADAGSVADAKAQRRTDARALKDLMRPVAPNLTVGRLLAVVSGVLAVVPYIALVHIGEVLLDAAHAALPSTVTRSAGGCGPCWAPSRSGWSSTSSRC